MRGTISKCDSGVLGAMLIALGSVFFTSMAFAGEEDFASSPEVTFENLVVESRGGQIAVEYEIDEADWKKARDSNVTLWASLYFPTEFNAPDFVYKYTMEFQERDGRVKFPQWLTPPDGGVVGVCVMGTRPGDNLGLGKGYMCDGIVTRPVNRPGRNLSKQSETVYLTYYSGYPVYPIDDPVFEGFNPPRPEGLELPQ